MCLVPPNRTLAATVPPRPLPHIIITIVGWKQNSNQAKNSSRAPLSPTSNSRRWLLQIWPSRPLTWWAPLLLRPVQGESGGKVWHWVFLPDFSEIGFYHPPDIWESKQWWWWKWDGGKKQFVCMVRVGYGMQTGMKSWVMSVAWRKKVEAIYPFISWVLQFCNSFFVAHSIFLIKTTAIQQFSRQYP